MPKEHPHEEQEVSLGGESFTLNANRAAYWEGEKTLLCSDLHWGREAFLQKRGFAVPEGIFDEEIAVLNTLIARYRPRALFVLGDLIHHPEGMHPELRRRIREWTRSHAEVEIGLIPGNHDRSIERWLPECGISLLDTEVIRSGIRLRHEPVAEKGGGPEPKFTWYGHLHPAVRVPAIDFHRKFPAFLIREKEAYLPAFSRLAGGAEIGTRGVRDRIFVIAEKEIFSLDAGAT